MATKLKDQQAPDFALTDINGETIRLSDYRGRQNVILIFNRSVF